MIVCVEHARACKDFTSISPRACRKRSKTLLTIQVDGNVYCQRPFCCQIGVQTRKEHKMSDDNSIAAKFSDQFSDIALYKQFNNDTGSRRRQFLSGERKKWNTAKVMLLHVRKPVGEAAITSLPWGKLLMSVSCSCSAVKNFAIFNHVPWSCPLGDFNWRNFEPSDPMAMACTPAYWTNKKCRPSMLAVSQLSLSQAPCGFGAPYHGFPIFQHPQIA